MAFDWFFKRTFRGSQGKDILQADNEAQDFVGESSDERFHESFDVPFIDPFGSLEDTSHDMFQRMDDMLNRMFSSSLTFGTKNFSDGAVEDPDPRSLMLKDPSFGFDILPGSTLFETKEPTSLIDSDIDDQVAKHGSLWKANPENNTQHNFSYKKISSIQTVRLPDGSVEEHHSITDNDGTVTTVRRTIGEQSHEITTHSDAKGLKEKQETFTNLDENDLHEFEKRWQNMKRTELVPARDMYLRSPIERPTPPTGDPSYLTLFKKFFGI